MQATFPQSPKAAWARTLLVLLFGLPIAVFIGLVSSTSNLFMIGIIGGVLIAVFVSFFPRLLLWSSIVGGIVIAGTVRLYYPPFQFVSWLVAGSSFLLLLYVANDRFRRQSAYTKHADTPGIVPLGLFFILLVIFTTLANKGSMGTTISGLKGYFQIWPLLFVMALVKWDERTMHAFPKAIFWIALLQIPLVLHQYLILVPQRTGLGYGIVPVDIVAGSFGGDKTGGGSNATLALFMIMVWAGALSKWKLKVISTWQMILISPLLLFPLFLNESKISVLFLGIIFLALYREDLVRRPHVFIVGVIATSLMVFALVASYVAIHANQKNITMDAYVQETIDQNFGDLRSRWSSYLNRYSVYGFWADRHGLEDPVHTLIGHGLAQSKEAAGAIAIKSLATTRYPGMGIGLSAMSSLLWDVGLIGTGVILAMFWWAWRTTGNIARHYQYDKGMFATFRALQAIIPVFVLSLAHKNFFVFDLPYQTLVFGTLGYIAYWQRCMNANLTPGGKAAIPHTHARL